MDLNSKHLINNDKKLKLTEKEVTIISYLYESNMPVKIDELQKNVWGFNSNLDTHTVETHVYRLRKKILNSFKDSEFIVSEKNGYKIK
jgi:DNA-binding response OmpR family regulator